MSTSRSQSVVPLALTDAVGAEHAAALTAMPWSIVDHRLFRVELDDGDASSLDQLRTACGASPAWRRSSIGGAPIPERELLVERKVSQGRTSAEIAVEMGISVRTVTTLRRRIRERVAPIESPVESRGVSIVGMGGLTYDVIAHCVKERRDDVNSARIGHVGDRVRVLVAPELRDMIGANGVRFVLIGALPPDVEIVAAVRNGLVAIVPLDADPDAWSRAIDSSVDGDVLFPPSAMAQLACELRSEHIVRDLSARDRDVIDGIRRGESIKQTARRLALTPKTVENRRQQLYLRFGVRTAQGLVSIAGQLGLESLDGQSEAG